MCPESDLNVIFLGSSGSRRLFHLLGNLIAIRNFGSEIDI